MSFFAKTVTEGNERADELTTDETVLKGGEMAHIRASRAQAQTQREVVREVEA